MANEELRKKFLLIHKSIEDKKKCLNEQLKDKLNYSARSNFDVKRAMLNDWESSPKMEYVCLENIFSLLHDSSMICSLGRDELDYNALFNDKVYSMIKTGKTSELIEEYEKNITN